MTPEPQEATPGSPEADRVGDVGLLAPGSLPTLRVTGDQAVVAALVCVEVGWVRALAENGWAPGRLPRLLEEAAVTPQLQARWLSERAEAGGNPVIPLVEELRRRVGEAADPGTACFVHRGLTSQDTLDTALSVLAADALAELVDQLERAGESLAWLAHTHRDTLMIARTLTQHAVPMTFGLKTAQWLAGVSDAREAVGARRSALPVQCGGAAGTMAGIGLASDGHPQEAARAWAETLGLQWPGAPWHTRRAAVTALGDALVTVLDTLGKIAGDIALMARPEVAELGERSAEGAGRSSTMPHKQNPVLSVLVRSAALQAPALAAQLHTAAALAVDERPDGAWHAEWPGMRRLLQLSLTAARQLVELLEGLQVHPDAMRRTLEAAGPAPLSERAQLSGTPASARDYAAYLGATPELIEQTIARWRAGGVA